MMGTSIAYHLAAARRVRRVAAGEVVPRAPAPAASRGPSSASTTATASPPRWAQQSLRVSRSRFPEQLGGPSVFTAPAWPSSSTTAIVPAWKRTWTCSASWASTSTSFPAEELADIDANAHLADDEVAAFETAAGYVEAVQVVASPFRLDAGAPRRRPTFGSASRYIPSSPRAARWSVWRQTKAGILEVERWLLAAGPWAATLPQTARVSRRRSRRAGRRWRLFRWPADCTRARHHLRRLRTGYLLPGRTHGELVHAGSLAGEEINDPWFDPDDYNEAADARGCRRCAARDESRARTRRCTGATVAAAATGRLYAITPDWHPILDRLPGIEGAYCAAGFSGHGFKLSPIVGQLMAELVVDGQAKTLDVTIAAGGWHSLRGASDWVKTPYSSWRDGLIERGSFPLGLPGESVL